MGLIRKGFISLEQDGHPDLRPDAFSEPCQTSKMKQAVNYFRKRLYLWRLMGFSEYSYAEKNNCFENSTELLRKYQVSLSNLPNKVPLRLFPWQFQEQFSIGTPLKLSKKQPKTHYSNFWNMLKITDKETVRMSLHYLFVKWLTADISI